MMKRVDELLWVLQTDLVNWECNGVDMKEFILIGLEVAKMNYTTFLENME